MYNYYSNGTEMVEDYSDGSGETVLKLQIQYKCGLGKVNNNSFNHCFNIIYNKSNYKWS